jgi:hypothetical protein
MTNPTHQTTNQATNHHTIPAVSIATARTGASAKANELGMRTMQERAYAKRGDQVAAGLGQEPGADVHCAG